MLTLQSLDAAAAVKKRVRKDTFEGFVTDVIASHEKRAPGAQVFLVEQDAHWVTPPHFHLEHQFQVVMAGTGSIGRHAVAPLAVHYAAPETGYGPISAGPDGASYMTLRVAGDTNAWYLHKPGSRERMRAGLKREQHHGMPGAALTAQELAALCGSMVEDLIPPRADGLAAHLVRLGPDVAADLPARHAHGGRYFVLTQGGLSIADAPVRAVTVAFASADEAPPLRAGAQGAEVLVLQFPLDASSAERAQ
jgi:hypothetical protein